MSLFDHFNIKEVIYRIYLLKVKHQQINQSQDFLEDLKRSLIQAEESTSYQLPDRSAALEGYLILAEQFQNNHQDYIVSAYFYKRVINIARQCNEQQFEGKGRLGYGKCHYQVGLIDQSINILEESQKLCEELGLETVSEQMSGQLIQIYNKMASEYEKGEGEQINQALHYYEKCREAAQKSGNYEAEGMICHKIGGLFLKMGNLQRSIQYQSKFLDIVKAQHKDDSKQKEMEAHASLAKCYIKKGDIDEAQKHLDQYHILAKDQKLHNAQSDAGLMLAKLHQQKGNTAKSLEYFQQHFDCAKSEKSENKNRKLIDKARVTYAIAKANAYIDNYIKLVANSDKNLKALLDWKQRKINENSNLQLYFHFILQQLHILFLVEIPSSKTIVAYSIQTLSSKIQYQFIHRKIGNLNLIYLFEFRTYGCINIDFRTNIMLKQTNYLISGFTLYDIYRNIIQISFINKLVVSNTPYLQFCILICINDFIPTTLIEYCFI